MCAKLGMTRNEYIELELKKHPDPELLKKAADALGITPEQLDVRGTYFGHAKDTENA
jgi:transcriptional regulator with XRE-family HTH domain